MEPGEVSSALKIPACDHTNAVTRSCDNAAIEPFIRGIQLHGRIYYRALDLSIQVSEDGYKICQDWVDLVEFWNDPNTEREDICEFVADMKDYASQAHAAALAMLEDFRLVRTGLNRVRVL
jgi:hypothetical protein